MNTESHSRNVAGAAVAGSLHQEFRHLRSSWWWFLLLGILLAVCGTAALIFPALTIVTSFAAVVILGVTLMIAGLATIVTSFWVGKWSGMLVQLLVGILYLVAGFAISETPGQSAAILTLFLASLFIVAGAFRSVAALLVRFPHWGWALLNGLVTLLCGVVIYRHFPEAALWVIGVLVGVEMVLQGWTWIMLSLAIRQIPADAA
jgi:uncharacterized membrane protein HdeD (DUF308 family)